MKSLIRIVDGFLWQNIRSKVKDDKKEEARYVKV